MSEDGALSIKFSDRDGDSLEIDVYKDNCEEGAQVQLSVGESDGWSHVVFSARDLSKIIEALQIATEYAINCRIDSMS